ncbi:hypothetical protein, partial [Mesorhizobium sp. M1C.F.Ca.ET.195.01.1.1]|uniref:hypothetical protein n=1 Tax=Mesorhizobium sp. M1C.F.Ca.ET.195.01.1.1 TaxID=2563927 RepID=UPI001AEE65E0
RSLAAERHLAFLNCHRLSTASRERTWRADAIGLAAGAGRAPVCSAAKPAALFRQHPHTVDASAKIARPVLESPLTPPDEME